MKEMVIKEHHKETKINVHMIEHCYTFYKHKEQKKATIYKNLSNVPAGLEGLEHGMTF